VVRPKTIAIQWCGKHTSTTTEGLRFLLGPCRGVILKKIGATVQLRVQVCSPAGNGVATEAEESTSVEAVVRKWLVETVMRTLVYVCQYSSEWCI
jgi:hypothetical protein